MKKFLLNSKSFVIAFVIANLFFIGSAIGQTNAWDGSGGNNWSTASSWSLGHIPTAAEDVSIPINAAIQVDVAATINSLSVSGATVSFTSSGGQRTITIDNTGSSIAAASTLTLNGSTGSGTRSMDIIYTGAARTMNIAGTLIVSATGEGSSYDATNSVTTVNGTLRTTGGDITSSATNLLISATGTYNHAIDGGTIATAGWNAASTCSVTGITTTVPGGLGQAFGNFTWNCAAQSGDISFAGALVDVNGNFTVTTTNSGSIRLANGPGGAALVTDVAGNFSFAAGEFYVVGTSASTGSVTMNVGGSFSVSGGTFYFSGNSLIGNVNVAGAFTQSGGTLSESSTGSGNITFNGASAQTYTAGGTVSNTINYIVNNAAGVSLANSVTIPAGLTLTSGKLTISTGATLTIANGNVIAGAPFSATKHIVTAVNTTTGTQGFLRVNNMTQSVAYDFPVGDGTNYLPATLNPSSATASNRTFSLCAFNGITTNGTPNGTAFTAAQKARCVDAVWTITYNGAGAPTSAATTVATAWPATLEGANFALVANALIGIAHYDGPSWGTAVGSGNNGTNVATRANVTTFSPFAVGIISAGGAPLAVKVNYFNAAKGNGVNTLNWNAACSSTQATFEIERSADGINFSTINSITASQARCDAPFNYDDVAPLAGTSYYRIKIIDANGTVSYTSKVKVNGLQKDMQLVGVLPNPVSNTAQLNITTTKKDKVELSIVSFDGKVMYRNTVALQAGSSYINLEVSGIATGTYFVKGVFADGQVSTVKFIKQ